MQFHGQPAVDIQGRHVFLDPDGIPEILRDEVEQDIVVVELF